MVMSNEPGYYADGRFGIRIENIDVIKMAETRENFGNKGYLELEHVTMVSMIWSEHRVDQWLIPRQCPIQTKLVDADLLTPPEKAWLNSYHAEVKEKVTPLLLELKDKRALAWLERECTEI